MAIHQDLKHQLDEGLGLPQDALYLMTELVRYREKRLSSLLGQKGISLHEWRALRILYSFKGDVAMSELIAHSQTDRTALGRTINQLVHRGWVKRFPAPEDKRALFLSVTDDSREIFVQVWQLVTEFDRQLLDSIDEAERPLLKRLLQTIMQSSDVQGDK